MIGESEATNYSVSYASVLGIYLLYDNYPYRYYQEYIWYYSRT